MAESTATPSRSRKVSAIALIKFLHSNWLGLAEEKMTSAWWATDFDA